MPFRQLSSRTASASRSYTAPVIITAKTNTHTSPARIAFHHRRLMPTFHSESTLTRAEYVKTPRPCLRSNQPQKPAKKPPRKNRCVGRNARGNQFWKKQIEAHAVEIEPAINVDMRSALEKTLFNALTGEWYSFLKRGTKKAAWIIRKKRANGGKDRIQKVRNVRVQDGSEGCSRAQLRDLMRGCAGLVNGAMLAREGGRVSCF